MGTATAITPTTLLDIEKNEMIRVLHTEHAFSDRFVSYMLSRNIRIEEDLIDQLFNSSEKRLARTLLLLARYGKEPQPQKMLPKVSQEMLAEMIGTTRSRVNFFMNKFRKLGFIHYNGGLQVHSSLLSVVLHEKDRWPADFLPNYSGLQNRIGQILVAYILLSLSRAGPSSMKGKALSAVNLPLRRSSLNPFPINHFRT